MKNHSRYQTARKLLIFWCLFIGVGAVAGAAGMLIKPDGSAMGMQALLPYFQVLPLAEYLYQDYVFPGIALLLVNGIPNLAAAALLLRGKKSGILWGGVFGVTLMLWICIQFVIFPFNFMSTLYFIFGLLQALTGYAAWVFYPAGAFSGAPPGIPERRDRSLPPGGLFLPHGDTQKGRPWRRRIAPEPSFMRFNPPSAPGARPGSGGAAGMGCTAGTCQSQKADLDLSAYEHVTICSSHLAFSLAAPVAVSGRPPTGKCRRAELHPHPTTCGGILGGRREVDQLLGLSGSGLL